MIDFNIWFKPINDAMDQIDFHRAFVSLEKLGRLVGYADSDYREMQSDVRDQVVECIKILYTKKCNDAYIHGIWHVDAHRDDKKKQYWVDICLPLEHTMEPEFD